MEGDYDNEIEVACPFKNCGAGVGMQCVTHHNDGSTSIRESAHVSRVKKAQKRGVYGDESETESLIDELMIEIESN